MNTNELLNICHQIAPLDCVWSKDNVGLLVDREGDIKRVLVALDVSLDVIEEAKTLGAQAIISHHPVIYQPLKNITFDDAYGRRVISLIKSNIACIAMHTNYDGAQNGINDELARLVGITEIQTLINEDGNYGRYGYLSSPEDLASCAETVKRVLNAEGVRAHDAGKPAHKVCVGSGGSGGLLTFAIKAGCDTLITGDVRHDVFCDARDMGINIIDAGHFATEDIMCDLLIKSMAAVAPELEVIKAAHSLKPFYEV